MLRLRCTAFALVVALLAGCGRVPFAYRFPAAVTKPDGPLVAMRPVMDRRTDKKVDDAVDGSVPELVGRAVGDEVASTGAVRQVVDAGTRSLDALRGDGVTVVVEPTLEELAWEVPGHEAMVVTVFFLSMLTGGIGALIYGATSTDVLARARVTIRMVTTGEPREVTNTYTGSVQESMSKLSCDSPSTVSSMAGKALADALRPFRNDATQFLVE